MNRLRAKRLLDAEKPLYVTRPMDHGDDRLEVGDEFPWREMGLALGQVYSLFRGRFLSHTRLADVAVVESSSRPPDDRRADGPAIAEWVRSGYLPEHYLLAHQPGGILEEYRPVEDADLLEFLSKGTGSWDPGMVVVMREEHRRVLEALDRTPPPAAQATPPASPEKRA